MDEEIPGSPLRESRPRLHRRTQKNKENVDIEEILSRRRNDFTKYLYDDSSGDSATTAVNPIELSQSLSSIFDEQLLLASAERMGATQRHIAPVYPARVFQSGINLQGIADEEDDCAISESELLNICDAAEKPWDSPPRDVSYSDPKTPPPGNTSKSIVELILEDFCCLPSSPELSPTKRLDRTPPFVLNRRKTLRTYERKRRVLEEFILDETLKPEEHHIEPVEGKCEVPHSSRLAIIQDEPSGCENLSKEAASNNVFGHEEVSSECDHPKEEDAEANEEPVVYVQSQRICANLLNLSDFFTSEDPKNCTLNEPEAEPALQVSEVSAEEIFATALEHPEEEAEKTDFRSLLVEDILALRQKYASCLYRQDRKKKCGALLGFPNGEVEAVFERLAPSDEEYKALHKNDASLDSDGSGTWFEEDSDIFATLDATVLEVKAAIHTPKLVGFQTASKRKITLSKEAQAKAAQILESLPDFAERSKKIKEAYPGTRESELALETTSTSKFIGFQTASKKDIKLSKEAQDKAAKILESLPELKDSPTKKTKHTYPTTLPDKLGISEADTTAQFVGFQTASNKGIQLSKEAQEIAAQILETLPELHETSKKRQEMYPVATPSIGFQTASRKGIKLSKEAQERAARILEKLPELKQSPSKIPKDIYPTTEQSKEQSEGQPQFVGFRTASKKSIQLSKEAQERAARILETLPELEEASAKQRSSYPSAPKAQERAARLLESLPDLKDTSANKKEAYPAIRHLSSPEKCDDDDKPSTSKGNSPTGNLPTTDKLLAEKQPIVVEEDFENMQLSEWLPGILDIRPYKKEAQTEDAKRKAPHELNSSASYKTPKRQCFEAKSKDEHRLQDTHTASAVTPGEWRFDPVEYNDENAEAIMACSTPINRLSNVSQLAKSSPLPKALTQSIIARKNLMSLNKGKKRKSFAASATKKGALVCDSNQNVCVEQQPQEQQNAVVKDSTPVLKTPQESMTPLPLKNNCRISGLRRRRRLIPDTTGE